MGMSDNMRGAALMTAAMTAFTVNDTCMKAVTAEIPLYQSIVLRGLLTMLALALVAPWLGGLRLTMARPDLRLLGWRSVGEVLGTLTFLTALRHMPLANLSAILQVLPLAVTFAAAVLLREHVGWRRALAIIAGFAGVMLIVRPGAEGFDRWALVGLASVACVVLRDLTTRQISSDVSSVTVAFCAAAAVTLSAACLVPTEGTAAMTLAQLALIGGAALFIVAGYLCVVAAMRVGDIAVVAPFRYTGLVAALVLGWLVFADFPDGLTLIGAGIVVVSGIYTYYRERRLANAQVLAQDKAA